MRHRLRTIPRVRRRLLLLATATVAVLAGCDDRSAARATFDERVVPVLEARCTSPICHGLAPGAEAAGDVVDRDLFFVDVDVGGRILDLTQAYQAALRAAVAEAPAWSPLLRKPLDPVYGGQPHFGGVDFDTPGAPGYRAIHDWIALEVEGGQDAPPLDELETLFAEAVLPALASMGCLHANCHGVSASIPYRLEPPLLGGWSTGALRANYEASRVMLALDGDPDQSRLLRKALPLHAGGVLHKGGNAAFLQGLDDPRAEAIRAWACAERQARLGQPCPAPEAAPIEGFVFLRGPITPHHVMELDVWSPGGGLWLAEVDDETLTPSALVDLTASLHADGPVDLRDPAVDPEGRRVAFALRRSAEQGHALWELDLQTGALAQLTPDGGTLPGGALSTDRDPVYGPGGHLWFVSTRAGQLADGGQRLDGDLYELDPASGEVTRRTWTPHGERKPTFYLIGEEAGGEVAFTALRDAVGPDPRAHPFRFPPELDTEYHQHFGITPLETLFHDMRETADGRYVSVVGDLDAAWPVGRLGVVDRNFGPEIPPDAGWTEPGLPFYSAPLARLDAESTDPALAQAVYRDPAPLPDGRLLVARAPGPFDATDPAAVPDLGIELLTLEEAPDGSGPRIATRALLVDEPGVADRDPEPILRRRPPEGRGEPRWDPEAQTGLLLHNGLPMIDALLGNLPPSGPKIPRDDLVAVRLIEALPRAPAGRQPVPPDQTRHGALDATTDSLGAKGCQRVLAELPLAADGTFQVELPAGVPFRIQALDADGLATGAPHNRWFYVAPGQELVQGTSHLHAGTYATRCAGCHGSASGDPELAFAEPDVVTTASLTLSRYEQQNPRRPIPAPQVGVSSRREVDFRRDVQPILDASCATAGCHDAATGAAGVTLTATPTQHYTDSYETLLTPGAGSVGGRTWVDERDGSARRSHLLELLLGVELDAPADLAAPGEQHGGLSPSDLATIALWIDLGATFVGTVDPGGP